MVARELEIRVLGELAVVRGSRPFALPASKKTRALLGYLAIGGRPVLRERLCELLWDGPDDPRAALRWSLHKLRPLVDDDEVTRLEAYREHVTFRRARLLDLLEKRKRRRAMHSISKMVLTTAAICVAASLALADPVAHTVTAPDAVKWGDAPPTLVKGAKLAVLYGDPSKDGLFIIRLKMPAGYKIAPHWHPTDENVTVISGSFAIGMGDTFDGGAAKSMPAGTFFSMPAKMHHFAWATKETIVEVSAMGPFVLNYVNPKDDPSASR